MIGIIGGGITGLALAHDLAARGVPFMLFEQEKRAGGVIRTEAVNGHLLELGPQRTRLTRAVSALVDELGLADELIHAPADLPLLVYHTGQLREVPFSIGALLRGDLLGIRGSLRVLLEPLTAGASADETVARYLTRKLGRAAYQNLAGPLYGGLYASDPADMIVGISLERTLRELGVTRSLVARAARARGRVSPPPAVSFRNGMQSLTAALHHRHRESIRTGAVVTAITGSAGRLDLETTSGTVRVERVVITSPARETARLIAGIDPVAASAIAQLRYNPLAVVHLHSDSPVPRGLGYQVGFGESLMTRGVTFNASLFGRQGVYTAYLGGAQHREVVDIDDAAIGARAAAEFATVTGARADVIKVSRAAMPAWDHTWRAFTAMKRDPADGLHFCSNWESRPGIPGRLLEAARLADTLAETLKH